jgi:two-component system, LuxR family, response regulator FixJ
MMAEQSSRKKVFIVDDEPRVLKAIAQTVAVLGCTITCFASAEECLETLKGESCDLLITDLKMPGMDGLALLNEAKALNPLLPVLVVTAYGDIPVAVKAVKNGAYDFIEKPLDENILIPIITSALEQQNPLNQIELNDTEKEILRHVANGLNSKEIGEQLKRSTRAVENLRLRLMRKLSVDNVAGLVKAAIKLNLTDIK